MSEGEPIEIKITKSPEYKVIYTNGVFGSVSPMEGRITFYIDRLIPEVIDERGGMKIDYIERELQVEMKMSPAQFISIHQWAGSWIEKLEKAGVLVKEITEKDESK